MSSVVESNAQELVVYPALINPDGTRRKVKRISLVANHDPAIHQPLTAEDFESEAAFDRYARALKKEIFPGVADGKKIESLEQLRGFDPKVHRKLKDTNFSDPSLQLEWKADNYEQRAKALRVEAAQLRKLGTVQDRARAKKLIQMQAKIAELAAQLAADGVDVEALKEATAG